MESDSASPAPAKGASSPLAPLSRKSYNVLGVEVSRETLSIIALALAAGIVIGARIQRTTSRLTPCAECERQRAETNRSIERGARDFEAMRRARGSGGGVSGGSEGHGAAPTDTGAEIVPPPAPSPTSPLVGPSKDEPPPSSGMIRTTDGEGSYPVLPGVGVNKDEPPDPTEVVVSPEGVAYPKIPALSPAEEALANGSGE